jgi:fatty-acyl-CoA synthase
MTSSTARQRRDALDAMHSAWQARTTAQQLDLAASRHPDRPLILTDEGALTYRQVADWSRRLAAGLIALGVQPGEHVAVDMANLPEVIALKFAVARVGAVSVSINFLLRHEELRYVLRQSDATVLITMDQFRDIDYLDALDRINPNWENDAGGSELPRLRSIFVHNTSGHAARGRSFGRLLELGGSVSDTAVDQATNAVSPHSVSDLLYTSGTTGFAKGVMLTHDAVTRTGYACAYTRAFGDAHRMLFALPIYHVFGYVEGLIAALFVGGAICPHATFDAKKLLSDIETHHIDELICVPAMTTSVLDASDEGRYDVSSLRTMFSSGAAHPPRLWTRMLDVLGVEQLFTAYGQTETTASTACTQPGDPLDRLARTVGTFKNAGAAGDHSLGGCLAVYKTVDTDTGIDLPVGATGEFVVRGPIVTPGYYNMPDETRSAFTEDGWFRTGDLGYLDENGYLHLTGRKKESYRCGGELVLPSEVEGVLAEHPQVLAAHVIGVPHSRMGEVGCAWVVPGPEKPDAEELIAYCASRLARFKVPAVVLWTTEEEIPRTVTGRVQKFALVKRSIELIKSSTRTGDDTQRIVEAVE